MTEALLLLALAAAVVWAVRTVRKRARRGGGCCGEHEADEKRMRSLFPRGARCPYAAELTIGGMVCDNCARRVENALNTLDGVRATVHLEKNGARVLCRDEPDEALLRETVRRAGYVVTDCRVHAAD